MSRADEHTVRRAVDIDAPPAVVWSVLEDVRRLPDFSPSTVEVTAPDRLTARGQTFTQTVRVAGRSFTSTWEVTAIEPGERLVIEGSVLPGTHYAMTEDIHPSGDGTRLSLTMKYRLPFGPLGRLASKLGAERRATEEAELVLDGVRRDAEAAHAA